MRNSACTTNKLITLARTRAILAAVKRTLSSRMLKDLRDDRGVARNVSADKDNPPLVEFRKDGLRADRTVWIRPDGSTLVVAQDTQVLYGWPYVFLAPVYAVAWPPLLVSWVPALLTKPSGTPQKPTAAPESPPTPDSSPPRPPKDDNAAARSRLSQWVAYRKGLAASQPDRPQVSD